MDVKAIFGRTDSLSVGEALSQLAFGKSCHQPASFSHRSLAHSAENRRLHFIIIAHTKPVFPHFDITGLTILIKGDDDMLTKYTPKNREQLEMITLDQLVPENHFVRKVEAAIDFSFIYSLVEDAYSAEPSLSMMNITTVTFVQEDKSCLIVGPQKKAIVSMFPIPFIVRNVHFYLSARIVKTIRS